MKDKVILIGPLDIGNSPTNGVTAKNQLLLERLNALFTDVKYIDMWKWRKKPWLFILIALYLFLYKDSKFIISAGAASSTLFNFIYTIKVKRNLFFWVIGGNLANNVRAGKFKVDALKNVDKILVEGVSMKDDLNSQGLFNVVYVSNFKPINFKPEIKDKKIDDIIKFVFLSRVHPDKGCDDIFKCVEKLNNNGYSEKFEVDFWGPVLSSYKNQFYSYEKSFENVNYRGYLNLSNNDGYSLLSSYDFMLFPTFWGGEGFPGVLVDAYIAGLPIIASDWRLNKEIVHNNQTGFLFTPHNCDELFEIMKNCILRKYNLSQMRMNCLENAVRFDYKAVLSEDLFRSIGFK